MGKRTKLLGKARKNPRGLRFDELRNLAKYAGFQEKSCAGDHWIYVKEGVPEILNFQPQAGEAKPYQVRQLLKYIDKYEIEVE